MPALFALVADSRHRPALTPRLPCLGGRADERLNLEAALRTSEGMPECEHFSVSSVMNFVVWVVFPIVPQYTERRGIFARKRRKPLIARGLKHGVLGDRGAVLRGERKPKKSRAIFASQISGRRTATDAAPVIACL